MIMLRGMVVASLFIAMSGFVVQFVFPWEFSNLGNSLTFIIYSALGLIAFLLIGRLLPETKGKSLEELEQVLASGRKSAGAN